MSKNRNETDSMIAAVNRNHREACHREQMAGYERRLGEAHRQALRAEHNARVEARHRKLHLALLLTIGARCAVGVVEVGMVHIELGLGMAAAGLIGALWICAGLWQEFKRERAHEIAVRRRM